jgi:hypothetical protein
MPQFKVEVSKDYHQMGSIVVGAKTESAAIAKVDKMMANLPLQTDDPSIQWDDMEYVDFSFNTTGEAEAI